MHAMVTSRHPKTGVAAVRARWRWARWFAFHAALLVGISLLGAALGGCAEERDDRRPRVVVSSLADGTTGVEPQALAELEVEFDEPMDPKHGRAVLRTSTGSVELALRWDEERTVAAIGCEGAILVDRRYTLSLEGFKDPAGNALDGGAVLPGEQLRFATRREDFTAPVVVASVPAHLQAEVYPAPVDGGTAPRVRVAIRFSEPMDPEFRAVSWGAVGGEARAAQGAWAEDLRELSFAIEAPAFAGRRPLEDRTSYQVDVSGLADLAGNPARLAEGAPESALRFSTGEYDALLNHSCGHVAFGPFASVNAAAEPGPLAPRSDAAHTRFTVTLPMAAGVGGGYAGYTRLRAPADAAWHLFLDGEPAVMVQDLEGQALPVAVRTTPAACRGITHRATFHLRELDQVLLAIGPQVTDKVRFIVEQVATEGSGSQEEHRQ
jgi:Bacterial Ig-like domain